MHGLRFSLPMPILVWLTCGCLRGLPVLVRAVSRRANGSRTTPGSSETQTSRFRLLRCCLPGGRTRSAPGWCFSKLNSPPPMPLSTLHLAPRGTRRKTRGQDGSLLLSCGALSSPTARRFIPALALPYGRGSFRCSYRWIRAEPPLANARTCSTVAMVVSPGKVVSSPPWAQPSFSASSGASPVSSP
jgi:hypothetical protein